MSGAYRPGASVRTPTRSHRLDPMLHLAVDPAQAALPIGGGGELSVRTDAPRSVRRRSSAKGHACLEAGIPLGTLSNGAPAPAFCLPSAPPKRKGA